MSDTPVPEQLLKTVIDIASQSAEASAKATGGLEKVALRVGGMETGQSAMRAELAEVKVQLAALVQELRATNQAGNAARTDILATIKDIVTDAPTMTVIGAIFLNGLGGDAIAFVRAMIVGGGG